MPVYPNRDRTLRHIKRTQAAYLYGRFPQRVVLGMPCCSTGFLTRGDEHTVTCQANLERLQGAIVRMHGRLQMAYQGAGFPQEIRRAHA